MSLKIVQKKLTTDASNQRTIFYSLARDSKKRKLGRALRERSRLAGNTGICYVIFGLAFEKNKEEVKEYENRVRP